MLKTSSYDDALCEAASCLKPSQAAEYGMSAGHDDVEERA